MIIKDKTVINEAIKILERMEWCTEGGCKDCRWYAEGPGVCLAHATGLGLRIMKDYHV